MSWPTPQDYNEAIQNPKLCFDDPELKAGQPELNALGLPRPICGGFASVYRMHCGQRDWAVRCFLREFTDQQQRYAAISHHLAAVKLPYIVGFDFLSKGIKVRNQWYPILKMEWVKGELLHDYIKTHLNNSAALLKLAERWQAMIKALQGAAIGHGDLQHGNVLVVNNDFRLIDYDCMFVPALAGQMSHEIGHRNYQHPLRNELDFGTNLDNFAAWVIYTSLIALSIDHQLWHQIGAGDEFILFRREDFADPDASSTLSLLTGHTDTRIQSLAALFRSLLYLVPQQIPALSGQLTQQATPPIRTLPASIDWLTDYVKLPPSQRVPIYEISSPSNVDTAISLPIPTENSAWVLDFISPPKAVTPKFFTTSVRKPRIAIWFSVSVLCVLILAWNFTGLLPTALIVCFAIAVIVFNPWYLVDSYRNDPAVVERKEIVARENEESYRFDSLQQEAREAETKKKNRFAEVDTKKLSLQKQMTDLQGKEQVEKNWVDTQLKQQLNWINNQRLILNREETEALAKARKNLGQEITNLNQQISLFPQAVSDEISKTLQARQNQFIKDYLSRSRISDAAISGIGNKLKARLRASGISTAAEVEHWRVTAVEGIGTNKGNELVFWRDSLIAIAKRQMPTALVQSELNDIKQKYESQKRHLEVQRDATQRSLTAQEQALKDQYLAKRKALDVDQSLIQNKSAQELQAITRKYAQEYATISQKSALLTKEVNAETQKMDAEISKLRKKMFDCHWQLAKAQRELKIFDNVSLRNYIHLVLLGRPPGH